MNIEKIEYSDDLDKTPYESIFQLDYIPNENVWSIDSCTIYIPEEFIIMKENPLTSKGGKYMYDTVNDKLLLEGEKFITGYHFEGKYQDYYIFRAQHNRKNLIGFQLTSKILGKDYYLGISKETFPIVIEELKEMLRGSFRFLPGWIKFSYFSDIEYKRDSYIDPYSYRETLQNIANAYDGEVKRFYNKQQNEFIKEDHMLLTGITNKGNSQNIKRSTSSIKNANWHMYIKNFQMSYYHKLKKNKNIDSTVRNYNGHYEMLKLCGRPKDLVLRLEVNLGNSRVMDRLGIEKSVMNILSMNSEAIENKVIFPLLRGKFSNLILKEEKEKKYTSDFLLLNQYLKDIIKTSNIQDAEYRLKELMSKMKNLSDRTKKSIKQRIKFHLNYLRSEFDKYQLQNKDMFDVFGEKLAAKMLLSKIPTEQELKTLDKKLSG